MQSVIRITGLVAKTRLDADEVSVDWIPDAAACIVEYRLSSNSTYTVEIRRDDNATAMKDTPDEWEYGTLIEYDCEGTEGRRSHIEMTKHGTFPEVLGEMLVRPETGNDGRDEYLADLLWSIGRGYADHTGTVSISG